MIVSFGSPDTLYEAFIGALGVSTVVALAIAAVTMHMSWRYHRKLNIRSAGCIAVLLFLLFAWGDYAFTFGQFISAEVNGSEVRLRYVGLFAREKILPRNKIDTVLFGIPGKMNNSCYLRIVERSGRSYRSAMIPAQPDACKNLRTAILAELAL